MAYVIGLVFLLVATGIVSLTVRSFLPLRRTEEDPSPNIMIVVDKALVINCRP